MKKAQAKIISGIITAVVVILVFAGIVMFGGNNKSSITGDTISTGTPEKEPTKTIQDYTLTDVANHKTKENCWMVINGKVYDMSAFIAKGFHGPAISKGCGIDATEMFEGKPHSAKAQSMLPEYEIGNLAN